MPPKSLTYWFDKWNEAGHLACFYGCTLTATQFCAANGLEESERASLLAYLTARGEEVL